MIPRTELPEVKELPTVFGWLLWDEAKEAIDQAPPQDEWEIAPMDEATPRSNHRFGKEQSQPAAISDQEQRNEHPAYTRTRRGQPRGKWAEPFHLRVSGCRTMRYRQADSAHCA
jgi:hypothetical protein